MNPLRVLAVAVALVVCVSANDPYIMMRAGETQCFLADVPADTQLVATYAVVDAPVSPMGVGQSCKLKAWIEDPDGFTVATSESDKENKPLIVRSGVNGEFRACVTVVKSSVWGGAGNVYKVALTFKDGVDSIDYSKVAKTEELSQLQVSLRRSNDQVVHIRNEQGYQRTREARFRETSESTSRRVIYLAFLQIAVFAGCTVYQLYSLRTFFKKNKLY